MWGLISQIYSFFKSLTPCCVSLRGVTYFATRKLIFFKKNHFNLFIRGPQIFSIHEKKADKSRDAATLKGQYICSTFYV